jgi:hypothetical protein
MAATYDPRTPVLLPLFNGLLARHFLPTLAHPSEATPSLLVALYESLIQSRLASINRRDRSAATQIRNVKLLLGEMVMVGWDVGGIDPQGVVEREETCLMDMIEIFCDIGRDKYGAAMSVKVEAEEERGDLDTISEGESDDSVSTIRGIHARAENIVTMINALNPNLRPPSPTDTVISRGTQTSPPPPPSSPLPVHPFSTRPNRLKQTPRKRTPRRRREKAVQTDEDTESGIPSSIPLSYSSASSMDSPTFPKLPFRRFQSLPTQSPRHLTNFSPLRTDSPARPRLRYTSSSSSEGFRVDSPYTAALRRRRQAAIDSLRKNNPRPRKTRIRVFSRGKDVGDSTFAEDSDASPLPPPRSKPAPKGRARQSGRTGGWGGRSFSKEETGEETTDGLTDLERRVRALKIWGEVEEERKDWLLNELQRRKESGKGSSLGRRSASVSSASGSSGSLFSFVR